MQELVEGWRSQIILLTLGDDASWTGQMYGQTSKQQMLAQCCCDVGPRLRRCPNTTAT